MKTTQEVLAALQAEIVNLSGIAADLQAIVDAPAAAPASGFVPTEAQVQAAVDAGIIAAFTPASSQ